MELVDVYDENNEPTGQVTDRWNAVLNGLWRRTVSCWIMNEKGEILLQKRSKNKKRNPGRWAKTGGQVDSGEDVQTAIIREVKEELGIDVPKNQVKIIDIYKSMDKNKRFSYNFLFTVNYKINEYILQKEEVDEVKYVTIEEMENQKNNIDYTFYDWSNDDFKREMKLLKKKRSEISEKQQV